MKHQSQPIPIIFMASDPIALPVMAYLKNQSAIRYAGVYTQPDRPKGRGQAIQPNPIKLWAQAQSIPVYQPEKLTDQDNHQLQAAGVQAAFVMAYGKLLKQDFLDLFPLGAWNFHASLLPAYRGACPIEAAILQGDSQTGITLMQMVLAMDAGAIVDQERIKLDHQTDIQTLRHQLSLACIPLMERQLNPILKATPPLTSQDETQATYVRKLEKADGALDFSQTAAQLERQIRAFKDWPGSFFSYHETILKVRQAQVIHAHGPVGQIMATSDQGIDVGTSSGLLRIQQIQRPGGQYLPASDFLRGYSMPVGSKVDKLMSSRAPIVRPNVV